jgi:hypothetical protein
MTSDSALRRYFRHRGVSGRGADRRECAAATSSRLVHRRRRAQQLRQLGDVGGDPPGLIAGEEVRRRPPSRLLLAIDVSERLPVGVADDEAGVGLLDGPGRREAARHGCGPGLYAAASPRSGIHGVRHMLNGDLIQGEWTASEPG